jgi:TolA-binding protein
MRIVAAMVMLAVAAGLPCARAQPAAPAPSAESRAAPTSAVPAGAYQRLVSENLDLREAAAQAAREADQLRRENARLVLQVQELEQRRDTLTALLRELRTPEEVTAELTRLRNERAILMGEVDRLGKAGVGAGGAVPVAVPQPGSDLYRRLEAENQRLTEQLRANEEARLAEQQARGAEGQKQDDLRAAVATRERENAGLRRDLEALEKRRALEREALRRVAEKALEYQDELRRLREPAAAAPAPRGASPSAAAPQEPAGRPDAGPAKAELTPELLYAAARKLIAEGRYADAERVYSAALRRTPDDPRLHYNLAVLYDDYLRNPGKAAVHYRKYLQLNPTGPDAALVRAWLTEMEMRSGW